MLVLSRETKKTQVREFHHFSAYLRAGDCLVLNDTRVIPARLYGQKETGGGAVEALLLEPIDHERWLALLRPARRLKPGTRVRLHAASSATTAPKNAGFEVVARRNNGGNEIRIIPGDAPSVEALLEVAGHMPLPPYIHRVDEDADRERYQTVYATNSGAVAAPTAGLHFTAELLQQLEQKGISIVRLTLHVGIGTFRPVDAVDLRDHQMHTERFILPEATASVINQTRKDGGRIVAVGTTSVRVLETCVNDHGQLIPQQGETQIFLYPPYQPKITDALLTNFHLPQSTLLMLVSTFAPREAVLRAYAEAVEHRFRFYSYGDCMLII